MRPIIVMLALALAALPAAADELLGEFEAWDAAVTEVNGNKVCFISSPPEKAEGDYEQRGPVTTFVTHWPSQDKRDEISIKAGYTYKEDSLVTVQIGGNKWELWTDGDRAWAFDAGDEKALVRAMKGGLEMLVKGTSSRGTLTTDTYSLKGFTAAYEAISEACG